MKLNLDLELPSSPTVLRVVGSNYRLWSASEYRDRPARLTPRQALFYRNLIDIAEQLGQIEIPVDFETPSQGHLYLDHGCVKIAVHAGFLSPLANDGDELVSSVRLAWDTTGSRAVE
ncbi:MAG: hypothetical protein ABL918_11700 [Chakrabartia sp.]